MTSNSSEAQPAPTRNTSPFIWNLVIRDMQDRDRSGFEKYTTRLQANNGRDSLIDAYQEGLDLVVYIRQKIEEDRELIDEFRQMALAGHKNHTNVGARDLLKEFSTCRMTFCQRRFKMCRYSETEVI